HGRRDILHETLKTRYYNITREIIEVYLNTCVECQLKKGKRNIGLVTNPIISKDHNSRCQMDLIDMQSQPDGENKYIFVYQDHFTKFVILKPMKNKTSQDVAEHLTSIFNLFGAPSILHTDNGREFKNEVEFKFYLVFKT
ncbi:unnamed protein product, partial [Gordionus sp. m RMFG-2023]